MIKFENLHVIFNRGTPMERRALNGINLDINEGEFICVIGGNGAGKSTLLNALCGDIQVDRGHILIDGDNITSLTTWQRSGQIGRVFQDPLIGTCANLTIEENMALAWARGKKRNLQPALTSSLRDIFRTQLKRLKLGLEDRLKSPIGLLSGGQRQAVSLIMTALSPMKILALDEHTAALDPKTAAFILDLTREIVLEKHLTTLMVTHSMQQALDLGSRILMLHNGRIAADIKEKQKMGLKVSDLLDLFHQVSGKDLDDDRLLLG